PTPLALRSAPTRRSSDLHFLYRELGARAPDAYTVAARLSFGLWDSLPDPELLKAAAAGELTTREQVVHQAERMVADPRAWFKLRDRKSTRLNSSHLGISY